MGTAGYKGLIVWQKSFRLAVAICRMTRSFPEQERYGLGQQMRRAAISVPSNIAEGYGRLHKTEYRQFLSVAYGSLCELETQWLIAKELGYGRQNSEVEGLISEVGSMLYCMIHPKT